MDKSWKAAMKSTLCLDDSLGQEEADSLTPQKCSLVLDVLLLLSKWTIYNPFYK